MANVVRSIFGFLEKGFAKLRRSSPSSRQETGDLSTIDTEQNGWRQGSILPEQLVRKLESKGILPRMVAAGYWVVISHDCDVTQVDLTKEPTVEVIFAQRINTNRPEHGTALGQSYRSLQLPTGDVVYEFKASSKVIFDRSLLANRFPANQNFTAVFVQKLALWLASRYSRRGFAGEFNERIRPATKKLRKKLKEKGHLISAFYLLVEDDDLPKEVDYKVTLYGSIELEYASNAESLEKAQGILTDVEAELGSCEGIEIVYSEVKSEADISLADLRILKRWDVFNELTLKDKPPSAIPNVD